MSQDALASRLIPWLVRHRHAMLVGALLLTLASSVYAAKLYSNLRSDLEELLPETAPSVLAVKKVGPKLHPVNNLFIVLEGSDPKAMQRFADDLAARLRGLGPQVVEDVSYRTDDQESFLQRFGAFYLSEPDLHLVLDRIRARVAFEKRKANPLLDLVDDEERAKEKPPPLDFSDLEAKYGIQGADQFRDGYFQTPDGRLLALLVAPSEQTSGYEGNKRFTDLVRTVIGALEPARYDPTLKIGFTGEVEAPLEEQESLLSDLASSTAVVLVLVFTALYLFYRRWVPIVALAASLTVGTAVTFALSWFLIGYLNANTAFLGSIVLGNGINVGIIVVARYSEERTRGEPVERALETAWSRSLAATFVASFGAGLSYLSLAVTDFRGFSQFGVIGWLGMALNWLAAFLLLPPLIGALENWLPGGFVRASGTHPWAAFTANLTEHSGHALRIGSILLLVGSAVAVFTYRGPLIEYDVSRMRSQKSLDEGATFWSFKLDAIFKAYLSPMVLYADSPEALERTLDVLARKRADLGAEDPLREVRTLKTALPADAAAKLPLVRELRDALSDSRLEQLSKDVRTKAQRLRPPADPHPPTLEDLPRSVRRALTERDGTTGRIALAFPRKVGVLNADDLEQIRRLLRGSIAESNTSTQALAQQLLFADITAAIIRDGPRATLLALGAVILLVALVFRKVSPTVMTCGGLLLGVAWLVGAAAAAHVRLNFLNFVVLPITFGIGVDYAVNIVQRYRLEGPGTMTRVLRETGAAVALCSATTIIGYASLLVADNRALRGFGLLASLGELTCIAAALFALPAWVQWREAAVARTARDAHSPLL
ncbi:MAG TPA: MMPL family transporter [Myxococcaceae bacterium]|nr:MMPL family transporter [Myxococcaceae bacterium]